MSHYKLVTSDDVMNGPVDYSTPVGSSQIFLCSNTVRDHIERRKPATKKFTANASRDSFWLRKFELHAEISPDFITYARNKKGLWYAQAVCL